MRTPPIRGLAPLDRILGLGIPCRAPPEAHLYRTCTAIRAAMFLLFTLVI